MACGCKKKLPTMPPNEESEAMMFSAQADVPPGEVLVTWKKPTSGHTYRRSAITRRKMYDYITKGPFYMLEGDAAGRFKDEIVYVAAAVPTP